MSLGHVAEVALLGWFLLLPPGTSNGEPDLEARLSEWEVKGSYPIAHACDQKYQADVKAALTFGHMIGYKTASRIRAEECIPSDDPRLAK